ncbi:hypothetical protein E2C01_089398 [Portunus trituberculatus]|uniref:Uncharacterized protein n=1 Tax=Portunus trituberculatus TaxID=210409 RepID=A0A5B7JIX6_PORTR|nr:hypothetical protein [Portunus trituberculatus]
MRRGRAQIKDNAERNLAEVARPLETQVHH